MNRIDCNLSKLGYKISEKYDYKLVKYLPVSFHGILASGYYGDVYISSIENGDDIKRIGKRINKKKEYFDSKRFFVIKVMHDTKYNRIDINKLLKLQPFIISNTCVHFPIVYGYFKVKSMNFRGIFNDGVTSEQNIENRIQKGTAIGYLMENLGDKTFFDFLNKTNSISECKQLMFQSFCAVYMMIKNAKMNHGDFHLKNIMLKELPKPQIFKYKINKQIYQIKAKRYIPIIIDITRSDFNLSEMRDIKLFMKELKISFPFIFDKVNINIKTSSLNKFFEMNFQNLNKNDNQKNDLSTTYHNLTMKFF